MYLPVPGFEPTSSVFLRECVTRWAAVADRRLRGGSSSSVGGPIHARVPIHAHP